MFCLTGAALIEEFETAVGCRADARDDLLRSRENPDESEERLYTAKQKYSEAFIAWVTHRACCIECRAVSVQHDLEQFASV